MTKDIRFRRNLEQFRDEERARINAMQLMGYPERLQERQKELSVLKRRLAWLVAALAFFLWSAVHSFRAIYLGCVGEWDAAYFLLMGSLCSYINSQPKRPNNP